MHGDIKENMSGCFFLNTVYNFYNYALQVYMSDALGVGAFLVSSDEQVVLMKRGEHLAEAPGLWDIPGGHPEPQVRSSTCCNLFYLRQGGNILSEFVCLCVRRITQKVMGGSF